MKPYYNKEYGERSAHRFRARRQAAKKISLLFLILGILCVVISILVFAFSFVGTQAARHARLFMSLCYVGAGLGMLALRLVIEFFRNRNSSRRTPPNYQPRLGDIMPPPKETVALNGRPAEIPSPARNKGGAVLVMVLVLLALIAGLVVETQIAARSSLRRRQLDLLKTRLHQAAADAAWGALRRLANDEDLSVDHTNEIWAAVEEVRDPSGISTRVRISDPDRCFNLNNLAVSPPPAHARPAADIAMDIMTLCGDFAPVDRVDALTDWTDADGEGFDEASLYLEKKPPYEPSNRPVYAPAELLWVNGFSRAYFARHERRAANEVFSADIVDSLTVLPNRRDALTPVNVNTASREVLLGVLGIAQDNVVQLITTWRNDRPIRSIDQFFAKTGKPVPEELRPYLDVKSRFFTIDAQAYAEGHNERLQVLARRGSEGAVDVLQWVF